MTERLVRIAWKKSGSEDPCRLTEREWIVTNGFGGYAAGTLGGVITRGFHGYLVAALPAPLGRVMMLNDLLETAEMEDGSTVNLGGREQQGETVLRTRSNILEEFRLEMGLPVWIFKFGEAQLEKRVLMPHRQNSVHIVYRLSGAAKIRLILRPLLNFRRHNEPVNVALAHGYALTATDDTFEISAGNDLPPLRIILEPGSHSLTMDRRHIRELIYPIEQSRGYPAQGDLWSPGFFSVELAPGQYVALVASTEGWETIKAISPADAIHAEEVRRTKILLAAHPALQTQFGQELVLAADQFVIVPAGRVMDTVRAQAAGDGIRTIIAGYHWFTDWGRDTMISLEGLTLLTGRSIEAGYILRTFARYVRNGLIPNMFPEGKNSGVYYTADASLWFFHAVNRYLNVTHDESLLPQILPQLRKIIDAHLAGTDFGIGVDPSDGLLREGAREYPLTWMDAKMEDLIITPRRGKPVEINALWYNALRIMGKWLVESGHHDAAAELADHASRARESFQKRFWNQKGCCLYDVVDGEHGDDPSFRPNQILSFSLDYPILAEDKWQPVLEQVQQKLLTPVGLRSLAPGEPEYKPKYEGNLRLRDEAYHQGTVWAWLIGPFVDAWRRVYPHNNAQLREIVRGFQDHLNDGAVGSISEIFDAEAPYNERGCVAQAWSVSEVIRATVSAYS